MEDENPSVRSTNPSLRDPRVREILDRYEKAKRDLDRIDEPPTLFGRAVAILPVVAAGTGVAVMGPSVAVALGGSELDAVGSEAALASRQHLDSEYTRAIGDLRRDVADLKRRTTSSTANGEALSDHAEIIEKLDRRISARSD